MAYQKFSKTVAVRPQPNVALKRGPTVQFSVVGAISRTIAFPTVYGQFALATVHKSDVL
jgi:hypothetical protein